jgi:hypothetical protein
LRLATQVGAGEGIRTPDLLITNQLLYRPELRQPKQKWNYSTSCATGTIPTVSTIGGSLAGKWPRWVGLRTAALADDLEERDSCGNGHVQALNMTPHGYRRQPVAMVPDKASKPSTLGAKHQRRWYC